MSRLLATSKSNPPTTSPLIKGKVHPEEDDDETDNVKLATAIYAGPNPFPNFQVLVNSLRDDSDDSEQTKY